MSMAQNPRLRRLQQQHRRARRQNWRRGGARRGGAGRTEDVLVVVVMMVVEMIVVKVDPDRIQASSDSSPKTAGRSRFGLGAGRGGPWPDRRLPPLQIDIQRWVYSSLPPGFGKRDQESKTEMSPSDIPTAEKYQQQKTPASSDRPCSFSIVRQMQTGHTVGIAKVKGSVKDFSKFRPAPRYLCSERFQKMQTNHAVLQQ
ncbi:hypothetical protein BZA05DRAFT_415478 [Tricharina praecox]|uniref:uncharacterized protein n=1 Tax=Tricharina praecox TaxID=43433 RepID=UPI00221E722B|nr:uncharacterized protein BZA05DRAFT_415478 [Tricharina praecox]KAI5858117.1 hypothetical protein BZA05DRAFT_415478 [Tricharina praecox]